VQLVQSGSEEAESPPGGLIRHGDNAGHFRSRLTCPADQPVTRWQRRERPVDPDRTQACPVQTNVRNVDGFQGLLGGDARGLLGASSIAFLVSTHPDGGW
jgi:hypothetical protein